MIIFTFHQIHPEIKEIFTSLGSVDFLKKVEHGLTQNRNESANSTIWHILSKNGFANRKLVELAVYMAICIFNEGHITVLDVLGSLGVPISASMVNNAQAIDKRRLYMRERAANKIARRQQARHQEALIEDQNDYCPGLDGLYE